MSVYSTKDAFECYKFFLAIKRHFTSSYDYFKYNGKIKANLDSFERRKDKFFFYKLSKRREWKDIILANVLEDHEVWVGNLLEDRHIQIYNQWKKKQDSISRVFKTNLNEIHDLNKSIIVHDGQYPELLNLYTQGDIELETLIMLDNFGNFFSYWDKKIVDNILWPNINKTCQAYRPFLHYDKVKIQNILTQKYNTY